MEQLVVIDFQMSVNNDHVVLGYSVPWFMNVASPRTYMLLLPANRKWELIDEIYHYIYIYIYMIYFLLTSQYMPIELSHSRFMFSSSLCCDCGVESWYESPEWEGLMDWWIFTVSLQQLIWRRKRKGREGERGVRKEKIIDWLFSSLSSSLPFPSLFHFLPYFLTHTFLLILLFLSPLSPSFLFIISAWNPPALSNSCIPLKCRSAIHVFLPSIEPSLSLPPSLLLLFALSPRCQQDASLSPPSIEIPSADIWEVRGIKAFDAEQKKKDGERKWERGREGGGERGRDRKRDWLKYWIVI